MNSPHHCCASNTAMKAVMNKENKAAKAQAKADNKAAKRAKALMRIQQNGSTKIPRELRTGLSRDGLDWLVLATDPFHDYRHEVAGYPDATGVGTLVRCYQETWDLVAPGAGNWDAHVFTLPMMNNAIFSTGTVAEGTYTPTSTVNTRLGTVNAITVAAGGDLFNYAAIATAKYSGVNVSTDVDCRIIGLGIEVINTTAEMYKQGTVTAYQMPNRPETANCYYDDEKKIEAIEVRADVSSTYVRAPPITSATAIKFPNALQWEAKEGAYMVVGLDSDNNGFHRAIPSQMLICGAVGGSGCGSTIALVHTDHAKPYNILPCNINTGGIMLTGLSNSTTLTVKYKLYVELAPGPLHADVTLATPSAALDYKALELYSQITQRMPVATMSKNNANGDWFKAILRTIRNVLDPVAQLVGKVVPGVGKAYTTGANWITDRVNDVGNFLPFLP